MKLIFLLFFGCSHILPIMINSLDLDANEMMPYGYRNVRDIEGRFFGFVRGVIKTKDCRSCHYPPKQDGDYEIKLYDVIDENKYLNIHVESKYLRFDLYYETHSKVNMRDSSTGKRLNPSEYVTSWPHLKSKNEHHVVVLLLYDGIGHANNISIYDFDTFYHNYQRDPPGDVFRTLDMYGLDYNVFKHDCVTFNTSYHQHSNNDDIRVMFGYISVNFWGFGDDSKEFGYYGIEPVDLYQFDDVIEPNITFLYNNWRYNKSNMSSKYYEYVKSICKTDEELEEHYQNVADVPVILVCDGMCINMVCFDIVRFKKHFNWE